MQKGRFSDSSLRDFMHPSTGPRGLHPRFSSKSRYFMWIYLCLFILGHRNMTNQKIGQVFTRLGSVASKWKFCTISLESSRGIVLLTKQVRLVYCLLISIPLLYASLFMYEMIWYGPPFHVTSRHRILLGPFFSPKKDITHRFMWWLVVVVCYDCECP
jgi:hypothetical protein